ncbi:phosphatidylserine decarboxylase [Micromonospora sp. B11E3]|uniref:phosphatidylserine decarboxylase n=1 Tax=Micromonospora sp. B11E3 TaxID=3153562 RepID=UPI00325DDF4E
MTQSPAVPAAGRPGPVRIGERAARTLVSELARRNDPKPALLVGAAPESAVLAAAIDALLPSDTLTVVPAATAGPAALREHVTAQGRWVADRVRVVDSLAEADTAEVVIAAEALTGTVDETRTTIDGLGKYLADGAVLSVAAPATPGRTAGASAELERQAALHGVGSDLVLRNTPPVRVHRLRFTPASPALAARLAPAYRPSSVPLTRSMHIDSNGVAAAGIALGLAALARVARPKSRLWLLPALAAAPVAAFFRDPERDVPEDPSAVVAAADGQVLSVQRLHDERFGDGEWLRVAVFLSVLDVHVNRSPVAGKVVDYFVADGGFVNAMKPDAEHNVAAYTVLDTEHGTVVVAQRTGLIARRIVQRAPIGALLAKGERFGLIRFGSRTDVYLPADAAEPLVGPGDKVVGGATVIARWR